MRVAAEQNQQVGVGEIVMLQRAPVHRNRLIRQILPMKAAVGVKREFVSQIHNRVDQGLFFGTTNERCGRTGNQ